MFSTSSQMKTNSGDSRNAGGPGCSSEGPRQAAEMSQQEPHHDVQQMQMCSPSNRME